jgi:alkaline phosphatase
MRAVRLLLAVLALIPAAPSARAAWWEPLPAARNVIVLVPDGCSQSMVTLARWYGGGRLAVDEMQAGAVRTHSADSLVTDSAAAATALACGWKTANGMIGLAPPPDAPLRPAVQPERPYRPLASVLEAAQRSGRSVGLVVTDTIVGATPAGFAAHVEARGSDEEIAAQIVHHDLDVVFGGGRASLVPAAAGGRRRDGRNLLDVLRGRGVQVVEDREALLRLRAGRAWGVFAAGALAPESDRAETAPSQPSLAEMTATAIALLRRSRGGFFLLVEGSQVDKADHVNDGGRAVREFLAFDEAVRVALEFAVRDRRTLVVACPDHDTGGMTVGHAGRTPRLPADLAAPLALMGVSADALARRIGTNATADNVAANVRAWWNLRLTTAGADEITNRATRLPLAYALAEVVSREHTALGWASHQHTGVDVPLWSFGPGRPSGLIDNTEVAAAGAGAMRLDLAAATRALFVDAQQEFPDARLDASDPAAPALVAGAARLPVGTDLLLLDGREHRLDGVVLHVPATGRTYIPRQAVDLIRGSGKR